MAKLLYATPTGRSPRVEFVISMRALELSCKSFDRGIEDFMMCAAPVQMARSKIAVEARARKSDFVLMHDDDLMVGPQNGANPLDTWHALFDAHPDVGVIGAVYLREKPATPLVAISHPTYPKELCHVLAGFPDQACDVDAIATGFMMIRTSVLDALDDVEDGAPAFTFPVIRNQWGSVSEVGEDYDFCNRVRALGYRILADPRVRTIHMKDRGPLTFDRETWEKRWKENDPGVMGELRANCPATFGIIKHRGFEILDHTGERIYQEKIRNAKARKEAA